MIYIKTIFTICLVSLCSFTAISQDKTCEYAANVKTVHPTHLTELQAVSLRLGPILCNNALQVTEDEKQVVQPLMQEFAA